MAYKDGHITSEIIAGAMEVHNTLRQGFQEYIYQKALKYELDKRKIVALLEVDMPIFYKGEIMGSRRVDLLIDNRICVELKAVVSLEDHHMAQAFNYLEAFNLEIGLLLNFGGPSLQIKRLHNKRYNPAGAKMPNTFEEI
jgi:GxxExxY protein